MVYFMPMEVPFLQLWQLDRNSNTSLLANFRSIVVEDKVDLSNFWHLMLLQCFELSVMSFVAVTCNPSLRCLWADIFLQQLSMHICFLPSSLQSYIHKYPFH